MFDFRLFEWSDGDEFRYDECGNTTEVILRCGYLKLPLCRDCLETLKVELDAHLKPHFCYECEHFGKHRNWVSYGGTCLLDHPDIKPEQYGEIYNRDPFNSCPRFNEAKTNG